MDDKLSYEIEKHRKELKETRAEVEKISDALFGDEGIVAWARDHIEAEQERKEIYKELRKRLAVRGVLGAAGILVLLLWYGIKFWLEKGGNS